MSLFQENPQDYLRFIDDLLLKKKGMKRQDIDELVAQRNQARQQKDFKKADKIRDHLLGQGLEIRDGREGTQWEVQKGGRIEP